MDVDLRHIVERHGNVSAIYLAGVIDYSTASLLRRDIDECVASDADCIELHLGSIELIDSSGLGALIHAYKLVHARGKELVFLGNCRVVSRLLARTSLDRVIRIVPETDRSCLEEKPATTA